MSTAPRLTSTSYAILGLLAIRPWTTYELAKQMDRAFSRFWPRARSKLYEEPKKLVAAGLARAHDEPQGRRRRTVHTITPKGRRALASWLAVPPTAPVLESEVLLKVFLAEHGTRDDLLASLAQARTWADERRLEDAAVARSYLTGGPFPERRPQTVLVRRFLADFADLVHAWSVWAVEQVEAWPEDIASADTDWATLVAVTERGRPDAG